LKRKREKEEKNDHVMISERKDERPLQRCRVMRTKLGESSKLYGLGGQGRNEEEGKGMGYPQSELDVSCWES
jgi:hypothetical protein